MDPEQLQLFVHQLWTELSRKGYYVHPNPRKQSHCRSLPPHFRILHPRIPRHLHLTRQFFCNYSLFVVSVIVTSNSLHFVKLPTDSSQTMLVKIQVKFSYSQLFHFATLNEGVPSKVPVIRSFGLLPPSLLSLILENKNLFWYSRLNRFLFREGLNDKFKPNTFLIFRFLLAGFYCTVFTLKKEFNSYRINLLLKYSGLFIVHSCNMADITSCEHTLHNLYFSRIRSLIYGNVPECYRSSTVYGCYSKKAPKPYPDWEVSLFCVLLSSWFCFTLILITFSVSYVYDKGVIICKWLNNNRYRDLIWWFR